MSIRLTTATRLLFLSTLLLLSRVATAQVGDVSPVHDPCVIKQGSTFYLVATGRGLPIRTSPDLIHWTRAGVVFDKIPAWAAAAHPKVTQLWAPDLSFTHGEYRLYYAVSDFGTSNSSIGLATSPTLDPTDPKYGWTDRGPVLTTHPGDDWNAIDPAAFTDADGHVWLAAGSYWTGIKLFKVDAATGQVVAGDKPRAIAARPGNTSIEAAFLSRHGDWYYLWTSFDRCCQGINSTYNTRVGRSKSVEGPYVDADNRPLLQGGSTLVLGSEGDVRGPGHCAVLREGDTDFLVHHWYDAAHNGRRTLGIHAITWDAAGWPHAGPMLTPATQPTTAPGE